MGKNQRVWSVNPHLPVPISRLHWHRQLKNMFKLTKVFTTSSSVKPCPLHGLCARAQKSLCQAFKVRFKTILSFKMYITLVQNVISLWHYWRLSQARIISLGPLHLLYFKITLQTDLIPSWLTTFIGKLTDFNLLWYWKRHTSQLAQLMRS